VAELFFSRKDKPLPDKDTLWRKFARDLSSQERLRLKGIIFSQTVGKRNATLTALHFGISRRLFIKGKEKKKEPLITTFSSLDQFNLLWHIDSLIISWYGVRRTIITAIEEVTKIAYARVYPTHSSTNTKDFLRRLVYLTKEEIRVIHSDNGAEFAGHFEKACQDLNITQVYSRVRQPKDNASLERFNRTLQEEWLSPSLVGLDDINKANLDLTEWLIEYNAHRPHQALDYQTPLGYAQERFFKVLPASPAGRPMWSASTNY